MYLCTINILAWKVLFQRHSNYVECRLFRINIHNFYNTNARKLYLNNADIFQINLWIIINIIICNKYNTFLIVTNWIQIKTSKHKISLYGNSKSVYFIWNLTAIVSSKWDQYKVTPMSSRWPISFWTDYMHDFWFSNR